jgi:hypothetical protein
LGVGGDDQRRFVAAGQTVDLKADQRALDNGEFARVADPCRAGGQPGGMRSQAIARAVP